MKEAASQQLDRTSQELVYRVVDAYYGVLLARKQSEVAEQSVKTSQAILDRSRARFESGLSVEADLLSAQVRMASRQQEAIRAKNNFEVARAQLDVVMGLPFGAAAEPADVLAERATVTPPLDELEKQALEKRPDLQRVRSEESAQEQNVSIAKSSFGPRVNAFAGWEMDNPKLFAGGGGNNWTGGLEVQLDLFTGGAKKAQLSRERALQEKMAAFQQAASDTVRLDVHRAYYDLNSARKEIDVTRSAVTESQEGLRIHQNRYEAGLIAIADLLAAEDAARQAQASYWQSVYRLATSSAALELATGTLNSQSPVVQP
jgi:outer membrane protein TolC